MEGRNPNALFDTGWYLQHNPDVAAAGVDPVQHYELFGWKEGREPGPNFDDNAYLASNPDVALAGMNPLDHYTLYGQAENRTLELVRGVTCERARLIEIGPFLFRLDDSESQNPVRPSLIP